MPSAQHVFRWAAIILFFVSASLIYSKIQISVENKCFLSRRLPTETGHNTIPHLNSQTKARNVDATEVSNPHAENGSSSGSYANELTTAIPKHEKRKSRILCWILTGVLNHMTRAIHVKRTWGSRCDILLFMSSKEDERLGTIALPAVEEGRDQLWPKTVAAFRYVWEHHRNDAEWFLKADDDTWVFTNNLRSFLNPHDPNEQHYFGCHWDSENGVGPTYNHGGTGYVVSKETLRRFILESLPYPEKCYNGIRPLHLNEDQEFGACLQSIGILPENTKDRHGRARFLSINVAAYVRKTWKKKDEWKQRLFWIPDFSDQPISFHKVRPEYMYVLEYLTNYLKLDAA